MADDYERLVVLIEGRLDQFEKAMAKAERAGTKTYQRLQDGAYKATTAIEKQMLDSAKAQGRALDSVFGQTVERANKSAKESAAFFREMERGRESINQLRASYDPLFANSMRYERALEEINEATRRGIISEREQQQMLDQVSAAYLDAGQAAGAHSGSMGRLGNISAATSAKLQNAGFQVQDVAVQIMGGTDAARALSMQLPQLLGGFGLVGVAVGTLASIGLPLLGMAFGSAEGKAKSLGDAVGALENSVRAVNDAAATYTAEGLLALRDRYGEVTAEVLSLVEAQREQAISDAATKARETVQALRDELGNTLSGVTDFGKTGAQAIANATRELGLSREQVLALRAAMDSLRSATTLDAQIAALAQVRELLDQSSRKGSELTGNLIDAESQLRQLANAIPKANWLAGMIGQAETLADKLWNAVAAKAKLAEEAARPGMSTGSADWAKNDLGFTLPGSSLIPQAPKRAGGTGRSGGGGRGASAIDALIQDLQTEREVVAAWYAESLAAINGASEAQLAAIGGRHGAIERLEAEHQERMRGIRDASQTGTMAQAETFFGAMATLTAAGGQRMAKAARATAAAEALINTYRAQAQVLADPKLGFWAKLPAVAAIGAAGMGLVSALGGSGKAAGRGGAASSSGGSAGGGSDGSAAAGPLQVLAKGLDPKALFTGQMVMDLYDAMMKEAGNRGVAVTWA